MSCYGRKKPMWFCEENLRKGQSEGQLMADVPELTEPD